MRELQVSWEEEEGSKFGGRFLTEILIPTWLPKSHFTFFFFTSNLVECFQLVMLLVFFVFLKAKIYTGICPVQLVLPSFLFLQSLATFKFQEGNLKMFRT